MRDYRTWKNIALKPRLIASISLLLTSIQLVCSVPTTKLHIITQYPVDFTFSSTVLCKL